MILFISFCFIYQDLSGEYDDGGEDETVVTCGETACRAADVLHHQQLPSHFEIVNLKDHLANAPLEYSYFDSKVMSAWAGPNHWRLKFLRKGTFIGLYY